MKVLAWDIGTRTLSCCGIDYVAGEQPTVLHWELVDIITEHMVHLKPSQYTMEQYNIALLESVRSRAAVHPSRYDVVLIEQQPAGGFNQSSQVTMKVLSHALYTYYHLHDYNNTRFISPKIKIRELLVARTKCSNSAMKPPTAAQRYRENKRFVVDRTVAVLGEHATFTAAKKKDDLCDAFMLAFEFVNTQAESTRVKAAKVAKADAIAAAKAEAKAAKAVAKAAKAEAKAAKAVAKVAKAEAKAAKAEAKVAKADTKS